MKKVFLMAMVAIALIACNGKGEINGSNAPAKDQKALVTVTTDAFDLIGQDVASVEKSLKAAGFREVENAEVMSAPAKKLKALKKSDDQFRYVYYAYNMPENADKMTEDEAIKYMNDLLNSGKFYILAVIIYAGDKVAGVETSLMTGVNDKINLTYTDISDKLYKSLPSNALMKQWQGVLSLEGEESKTYEKHEEYVAAVAKAKAVEAEEQGLAVTSEATMSGLTYVCIWERPSDDDIAEMKKKQGFAYAMGMFTIADLSASQGL